MDFLWSFVDYKVKSRLFVSELFRRVFPDTNKLFQKEYSQVCALFLNMQVKILKRIIL